MQNDQEERNQVLQKRKRVTKACQNCARSRRKCDGRNPCGTCTTQASASECRYSEVPSRRGPPKGYRKGNADPSSLIPKIAKIREHIQGLQQSYGDREVLRQLHIAIFGDAPCDPSITEAPGRDGAYTGHAGLSSASSSAGPLSNSSSLPSPISAVPAALTKYRSVGSGGAEWSTQSQDEPNSEDHSQSEIDEGSSSGMAFLASSLRHMNTGNVHTSAIGAAAGGAGPLTPVSDNERLAVEKFTPWAFRDDGSDKVQPVRSRNDPLYTPPPEDIEILLKTYWSSIHPHWPILYKPTFDAVSIFRVYEKVHAALLFSMYALAARLCPSPTLGFQAAENFRRIAEEEVQREGNYRADINTCTALFLLSLYYHGEGKQRQAWIRCGIAAMMAFDLGLHKSNPGFTIMENERRVRVFWNIFVYEKVLACEMGRPVLIRMLHCDPIRLSEQQADEYETLVPAPSSRYEPAVYLHTISTFNAAVDLFRIFEQILSEIHTAAPSSTRMNRENLVAKLDKDLEDWQIGLPSKCRYPVKGDRTPTRALYLCHMWYHVAHILLHRPFISKTRPGHAFVSNSHHKKATEHANKLVDLLAQFAAGLEIGSLPPNDAYLIFTAALLHGYNFTTNDKTLRDASRPRLEQCIEWLRGLARTWSAASQYRHLLDAFVQAATDSITHIQELSPTTTGSRTPQQSSQVPYDPQPYPPPRTASDLASYPLQTQNRMQDQHTVQHPTQEMTTHMSRQSHQQQPPMQHLPHQSQSQSQSHGHGPPIPTPVQRHSNSESPPNSQHAIYSSSPPHAQTQPHSQGQQPNQGGQGHYEAVHEPANGLFQLEHFYWNVYPTATQDYFQQAQAQAQAHAHAQAQAQQAAAADSSPHPHAAQAPGVVPTQADIYYNIVNYLNQDPGRPQ